MEMTNNLDFIVNFVRVADEGLDNYDSVKLKDISQQDRQDIKSLTFLPVQVNGIIDITNYLKGFSILENLYLPSMYFTTMKKAQKYCPMLKNLVILTNINIENALTKEAVVVNASEEDGEGQASFRTFVDMDKNG